MKKHLSTIIAILLAMALITALFAGCSPKDSSSKTSDSGSSSEKTQTETKKEEPKKEEAKKEEPKKEETKKEEPAPAADAKQEVITLDCILNLGAGLQTDLWWTDYLEEKTGAQLNVINGNDADLATYIAADNLPDVIHFAGKSTTVDEMKLAVQAGQLINYDDYKDQIPNVYTTINETALNNSRSVFGEGSGLYFLPGAASEYDSSYGGTEYGMRIHLPYFEEYIAANGYPELKTLNDFIPVLKWIQEQHPTNEAGQSAYGMSFFTDWDGNCINYADKFQQQLGYYSATWPCVVKVDDMTTHYAFEDNSIYYQSLKFMFNAQQAGIIDPDSLTQTWDDYCAKTAADRTYSSYCWSHPKNNKLVIYDEYHPVSYSGAWVLGNWNGNAGLAVAKKSDKIETALKVINFACDYDNVWYCLFGPQGEYWDLNSDGAPYITEQGYKMQEDETVELSVGGNPIKDAPSFNLRLLSHTQTPHPTYGYIANPGSWPADPSKKTEVQLEWEAFCKDNYGVDLGDAALSEIALLNELKLFSVYRSEYSDPAISEDMTDLLTRAASFVPDTCWKMIYAANEAEFESIWQQLQDDLEAINFYSVYEYEAERLKNGEIWYMQ